MSLESTLEALVGALNRNSDVMLDIAKGKYRLQQAPFIAQAAPLTAQQEVEKVIAVREEARELPNDKPKSEETPQTTSPTSEPTEPESAPVTYDDVKKVTIAVGKISKDKAVAGLAEFDVTSAKQLVEAQWADYIVFMNEVLEGKRYVD